MRSYSSGIGDGSFLLNVLCGVEAGCPLSSVLFVLCIHPFIDVFNWLSDNPGVSLARVCADGFGSTLAVKLELRLVFPGWLSLVLVWIEALQICYNS